jgi:hypothetical protein
MSPSSDNRSVHVGGDIIGASIVTGSNNTVTMSAQITLPPAQTVDVQAELAALRASLVTLQIPERDKLDRAYQYAEDLAAEPAPDRKQIAHALHRALTFAKDANDFAGQVATLAPRVAALASWLGTEGHALLSLLGLGG